MKKHLILTTIVLTAMLQACKDDRCECVPDDGNHPAEIIHHEINAIVAYQRHIEIDIDQNGEYDYSFGSVLIEENDLPYLYLFANGETTNGSKLLLQSNPEVLNARWARSLAKGAKIEDSAGNGNEWNVPQMHGNIIGVRDNGVQKTYIGPWIGKQHAYMGMKFKINGKYHYGWIRITHVTGKEQILVEDYAYNNIPEQPIYAGQE
ncbi:hypothetical protein GCM10023149_18820 [Mucilaginibacter gynuensis]|uniref:Lipoprotein n=1 Tax=Mucilaginibacter gynuensis TaxID=1302236 RepID=A0ABP8G9R7_9SPHI